MEPDYSNYTKSELEEALSSIDKERFPQRLAIILNELEAKKSAQQDTQKSLPKEEFGIGKQIFVVVVAICVFLAGVDALMDGTNDYKGSTYTREDEPYLFYFFVTFVIAISAWCINYVVRYRMKRAQNT